MPLPERIPPLSEGGDTCDLIARWGIHPELAQKLRLLADRIPYPLQIISGYRTAEEQQRLREEGRPAARDDQSTHRTCLATGADIWPPDVTATDPIKAYLGFTAVQVGLRWGGGSPKSQVGIPSDWNHFDLGPRVNP